MATKSGFLHLPTSFGPLIESRRQGMPSQGRNGCNGRKSTLPSRPHAPVQSGESRKRLVTLSLARFLLIAVLAFVQAARAAETNVGTKPAGQKRLQNFDYRGVTIDGGRMRMLMDTPAMIICEFPTMISKGFRQRAGLPVPGNDLGGWYSDDVFTFSARLSPGWPDCTPPPAIRPAATGEHARRRVGEVHRARRLLLLLAQAERSALHLRQDGRRTGRLPSLLRAEKTP